MKANRIKFSVYTFFLSIGMLFFLYLPIQGAPLKDIPQIVVQPNGEKIACYASGDEYFNYLHDKNGNIIIQDIKTGYYSYAKYIDEQLLPSDNIISLTKTKTKSMNNYSISSNTVTIKDIKIPMKTIQQKSFMNKSINNSSSNNIENAPSTGTINNIVVYIRFSDDEEFSVNNSFYSNMFNNSTSNYNSMTNYFEEVSYNKLTVNTTFYPEAPGTTVVSYKDQYPRGYYEQYSPINPNGYIGGDGGYDRTNREHTLIKNASEYISSQIPASLNVDSDNDGDVDNICFIVKGSPMGWSSLLWPHKWTLYSQDAFINNKKINIYNFQLETALLNSGVGVLCHEMLHSLGYPDLYHYSLDGMSAVGSWDVMEGNLNPPQHTSSYMKFRYGKWIDTIPEIKSSGSYTLNPLTSSTNNCFKIKSSLSSTEYFVVEYRKQSGTFENSLKGSGLLVYRVNTESDGYGNAFGPLDELYVFRPGGTTTLNGTVNSANLSADVSRSSIGGTSDPIFLSDGIDSGISFTNIGSAGNTISFSVSLGESQNMLPFKGVIEEPASSTSSKASLKIKGWYLYGKTISKIEILVDGQLVGTASRLSRPDLQSSNLLYDISKAGYEYNLDTTKLSNSSYTIAVKATAIDGETNTLPIKTIKVVNITGVSLNKTAITMALRNGTAKYTLVAKVKATNNSGKEVVWTSSDSSIVTVDVAGKLVALKDGEVTITVTTEDGEYNATCKVLVVKTPLTSIKLNQSVVNLNKTTKASYNLIGTISPSLADYANITWTTSNSSVATVSEDGTVTAVNAGIATVTATTLNGGKTAKCKVNVMPVSGVAIRGSKTRKAGLSQKLSATISPANAADKSVVWSSMDESIAIVTKYGKLIAVKEGVVTIKVTSVDRNYENTLSVKVSPVTSTIEVTDMTLTNVKNGVLVFGRTGNIIAKLTTAIKGKSPTNKNILWSSSDESVATVDDNGKVTPVSKGNVIITAATTDGSNIERTCTITVIKPVTKVTIDKSNVTLYLSQTKEQVVKLNILPIDATDPIISWSTSNYVDIAQIGEIGVDGSVHLKLNGKSVGRSTITFTISNPDKSVKRVSCRVNVIS